MNRLTQFFSALLEPLFAPLSAWFVAREPRERWLLVAAVIAVLSFTWYNGIHQPIQQDIKRYSERNAKDRETLAWMRSAAVQIRASGGASSSRVSSGSLLTIADSSLRSSGLGNALQRIQPDDENNVKIWLDSADFNTLLRWFSQMETQGLKITVAGITPVPGQDENGQINARITLTRPS